MLQLAACIVHRSRIVLYCTLAVVVRCPSQLTLLIGGGMPYCENVPVLSLVNWIVSHYDSKQSTRFLHRCNPRLCLERSSCPNTSLFVPCTDPAFLPQHRTKNLQFSFCSRA